MSHNLSGIYSPKLLIMLNSLQQMHLKLLQKRVIQNKEEATDDKINIIMEN